MPDRSFENPKRSDWIDVFLIFIAGLALGMLINAISPRGFNVRLAAGLSQQAKP